MKKWLNKILDFVLSIGSPDPQDEVCGTCKYYHHITVLRVCGNEYNTVHFGIDKDAKDTCLMWEGEDA